MLSPEKAIRFVVSQIAFTLTQTLMQSYPLATLSLLKHMSLDPNTYTDIYNDILLKKYTTAAFKYQWGMNLFKYQGIQLPGGVHSMVTNSCQRQKRKWIALRKRCKTSTNYPLTSGSADGNKSILQQVCC